MGRTGRKISWEGQVGKSVGAIKIIYKYFIRMFTSGLLLQYGKDR